jgi:DNA-binding CsgD family transcriptional regulator/tetratricopeptide (TPR) repeat protein
VLRASSGRLVGRDGELTRLLGLLDDASEGRPSHALISGDAGVGKTRLVAELATRAADRGFLVLSGRCAELGDSIPYLPLADALREGTTTPGAATEPLAAALAARPVLGRLLPDRDVVAQPGGEVSGLAQQQLFGAVLGLLTELADGHPVLLILEDLHWADRSTRDLITFLSRVLHRERVAVVATYRTDDLNRRHPLRPVVAELLRLPSVASIELGPLGYADMADHLTALAGEPLDPSALHRMVARAEGNPYYAEELLAAVAPGRPGGPGGGPGEGPPGGDPGAGGAMRGAPGGDVLPSGLAALLLARVEQLPAAAQQVLRAAAVGGRRVDDDIVRAASGLDGPEYEDAIRDCVAQQLLVPGGADGYVFRHALIREALYTDLLPGERTRLHARFAELLADPGRLAAVPGSAAELAHHCLASHDIAGAFAASVRAGQESERLAAPAEAHRHYDAALALWERVGEPEQLAGQDRDHLAFCSANCAASSGEIARAVQQLRRIRGFLREDSDPVLASRVHERLAYYLLELDAPADAETAARAAVQLLPDDPPRPQRARALATHAQTLMHVGDEAAAADRAQQAQVAARAADAPWVEADALVTLGMLAERQGEPAAALDLFTQAWKEAQPLAMLGVELRAAFQVARAQLESGDLASSAETAHQGQGQAAAAGLGLAPYGMDLQYLHYLAHYADGCWDHAQELADGFGVRVTTMAEARLSAMALFLDVARGSPKVAERRAWLEPFWPGDSFGAYIAHGLLAEHALWRGDIAGALAEVAATLAELDSEGGYGPPAIRVAAVGLAARGELARRARAAGDEDSAAVEVAAAEVLIEAAREGAAFPRRPKFVLGVDGRGWLARAEAEWARAQGRNDPEAWQAVVDEFSPAYSYETARSRWRLAEALAEAGQRAEAEREWSLALGVAEQLGAAPLASALHDLGRRARLSRPGGAAGPSGAGAPGNGPGGRPADALAGLTSRETEVLRLLVAGRSNREIAAALFIAPKTASVHVSNILAKLGAASRGEAAAIATAAGLAPAGR